MSKNLYSEEHKLIASRIRQARINSGLNQEQAAAKTNKSQSYISKIESGQSKIDVLDIKLFSDCYKVSVNELINGK